jgi:hypothetical protein
MEKGSICAKILYDNDLLDKQYVTWAYKNCKPNVELFKHILKSFLDKMI